MNKDKTIKLFSRNIDLHQTREIRITEEEVNKFRKEGYNKVEVAVFGTAENAADTLGHDPNLFENIRINQSVPSNVVFDFLNVNGSLSESDFKERIFLDDR